MSIIKAFENAYRKKGERNWDKIYVFVDIHETILYPTYSKDETDGKFYPFSKETLIMLSERDDVSLGIYSCTSIKRLTKYLDFFRSHNIKFEHININNETKDTKYADFSQKPYFDVLIDDKAGFNGETDWAEISVFKKRRNNDK